ncbi:MAG TPA: DUF1343 domain-containing protein [Lentisphaeria bacterium]|nr:MAG: hypothetical protein A2X48_12720 [Lentisphaerae bacterium GWF2_49_21]HBC87700.1 DUF1343 domain-containing protein [Lentisphaeria bacterium]
MPSSNKLPLKISAILLFSLLMSMESNARVYTGLEVFLSKYTHLVKGKRVGLVTNQTGVDANRVSTVALFYRNPNIRLVALFAPEHGIRGNLKAGETVPGGRDPVTRLPVYTLYGPNGHRPTREALAQIDVLVYDIQDVGSRTYTYIWHLAECMSACAAAGKPVIVLDRPNPYGAYTVDGPLVDPELKSFIGLYSIPRVYGMTVGELAIYLNFEERIKCNLTVVPMMNYRRGTTWAQTGLPWIPPSPNIPTPESAYSYASTGTLGETGGINIGIGSLPFQIVSAPWLNGNYAASALNSMRLPGVVFRPLKYRNVGGGMASDYAVQIVVTNPAIFRPATTEIAMLWFLRKYYPRNFKFSADGKQSRLLMFDKAMGTSMVRRALDAGWNYQQIIQAYQKNLDVFIQKRSKYLIYK